MGGKKLFKNKMTKCEFCEECDSRGNCFWETRAGRRDYCEKAIRRMVEALKLSSIKVDY